MKSILLVDDEAAVCAELQRNLCQFGYEVDIALTYEMALASMGKTEFDLILVEFNLSSERGDHPRTGEGLRLIRHLRRSGTTIPILVYTVMEGEAYETASLDAGADDFILKRTPISDFFSRVAYHTTRRGEQ